MSEEPAYALGAFHVVRSALCGEPRPAARHGQAGRLLAPAQSHPPRGPEGLLHTPGLHHRGHPKPLVCLRGAQGWGRTGTGATWPAWCKGICGRSAWRWQVPGGSLLPRLDEDSRAGAATRPRSRRGRVWDLAAPLAGQCPVGLIFSPVLSQEEACHAASCWSWLSTAVSTALTWKCCAAGGCKGIQQGAEGYGVGFTSLPQPWISRGSRTAVLGLLWSPRACPGALCRRNWRG